MLTPIGELKRGDRFKIPKSAAQPVLITDTKPCQSDKHNVHINHQDCYFTGYEVIKVNS